MSSRLRSRLILVAALLVAAVLYAGPRGRPFSSPPLHVNPNMDVQPRAEAQSGSAFFYDGASMRRPVPGTIARGELRDTSPQWTGFDAMGDFVPSIPIALDDALRERGRRRYDIYCAACHDRNGDGKGILFERGKVPTPTFHQDRLRQVPDGYIFGVITNGFGMMPSYGYPVPPADRWAIVAHIRELQQKRASTSPAVAPTPPAAQASAPAAPN